MLRFCMLCLVSHECANSICVVAMGVIHFLVCVTSVAHTFLIYGGKENEKNYSFIYSCFNVV